MQWFPDRSAEGLARFVFDWAIPILLIRVLANADLPDSFPWELFSSFYIPGLLLYAIGAWIARKFYQRNFMECVISGTAGCYGNTVLLGLPLVILAFGDAGTVPYFLLLSVHGIIFLTLTTVLLEIGRYRPQTMWILLHKLARGLLSNPILIGLLVGVALNLIGWRLPGPVDQIAKYMQDAVAPCALFALGASLSHYRIAGSLQESFIAIVIKLVIFPAVVWLLATFVFEMPKLWTLTATLIAAQPTGVNPYLFAERYGVARPMVTTSIFLSTSLSIVTLAILLYIFQLQGAIG